MLKRDDAVIISASFFKVLLQKLLAESSLTTLSGYVEWVNIKFLVQDDAILLQTLCLLLQEDELRLKAAECLEAIAGRKVNYWKMKYLDYVLSFVVKRTLSVELFSNICLIGLAVFL